MNKLKIIKKNNTNYWYKEGLRFKCTQCGKCCSGKNSYVWINSENVSDISKFLNISKKEFLKQNQQTTCFASECTSANLAGSRDHKQSAPVRPSCVCGLIARFFPVGSE